MTAVVTMSKSEHTGVADQICINTYVLYIGRFKTFLNATPINARGGSVNAVHGYNYESTSNRLQSHRAKTIRRPTLRVT